jgi:putative transcriptional regulator
MRKFKGKLLVAHPFLKEPTFHKSVILICEEKKEGHYGLVLNQPISDVVLDDVFMDKIGLDIPILSGGPVEPMMLQYLHHFNVSDAKSLFSDLSIGGDFNQVKRLLNLTNESTDEIKFFLGYSGWAEGQLEDELNKGSWVIAEFRPEYLDYQGDLWKKVLEDMGGEHKQLINYPNDPRLN